MKHSQTIRTLNELIAVSRDGEKGFRVCAQLVRSERLRTLFDDRSRACAQAVQELQFWVRELGGEPSTEGSAMGTLHRGWVDVLATLSRHDDETIIAECERGEGYALEVYRNALDDHLPEPVRRIVLRQFEGVVNNYGRIRRLAGDTPAHGRAAFAVPASETST